jgi:hypothetical protein
MIPTLKTAVSKADDVSRPRRRRTWTIRSLATLAIATFCVVGIGAQTASAQYVPIGVDAFNFSSSNSAVHAQGHVTWYEDGLLAPVYRGEYRGGVTLQRSSRARPMRPTHSGKAA